MNVTLEDAYAEACRALGESIVRERLLTQALTERESTLVRQGREEAAADIEAEAAEYEREYGTTGPGAQAAGVLAEAARIARGGVSQGGRRQPIG